MKFHHCDQLHQMHVERYQDHLRIESANEDRLLILCELNQGTRNVGELEELLNIHQPTLSQQLTVLREENLVTTERKGKYIYYSLASPQAIKIMHTLSDLYCNTHTL